MAIQPQPIRPPIGEAVGPERAAPYGVTGEAVLDSVKIDQAELVRTYSLLIPPDAEARISGQIRGWHSVLRSSLRLWKAKNLERCSLRSRTTLECSNY